MKDHKIKIPCMEIADGAIKPWIDIYDQKPNPLFSDYLQRLWIKARAEGYKPKPATRTRITTHP